MGHTVVSSYQLEVFESVASTDVASPQVMLALVSVPSVDVIHCYIAAGLATNSQLVSFSQTMIIVEKCGFYKGTIKVCVSCS